MSNKFLWEAGDLIITWPPLPVNPTAGLNDLLIALRLFAGGEMWWQWLPEFNVRIDVHVVAVDGEFVLIRRFGLHLIHHSQLIAPVGRYTPDMHFEDVRFPASDFDRKGFLLKGE